MVMGLWDWSMDKGNVVAFGETLDLQPDQQDLTGWGDGHGALLSWRLGVEDHSFIGVLSMEITAAKGDLKAFGGISNQVGIGIDLEVSAGLVRMEAERIAESLAIGAMNPREWRCRKGVSELIGVEG
jgi:hypothetical protein